MFAGAETYCVAVELEPRAARRVYRKRSSLQRQLKVVSSRALSSLLLARVVSSCVPDKQASRNFRAKLRTTPSPSGVATSAVISSQMSNVIDRLSPFYESCKHLKTSMQESESNIGLFGACPFSTIIQHTAIRYRTRNSSGER